MRIFFWLSDAQLDGLIGALTNYPVPTNKKLLAIAERERKSR